METAHMIAAVAFSLVAAWPHCNENATICAAFTPFDDVTALLDDTIASAHERIDIAVFNLTSQHLADALLARAHDGIDVRVLIDFDRRDNAALASLRADPKVHVVRIPSLRGGGPQMHAKLILVDDRVVVAGTGNLTDAALVASAESWLSTTDDGVAASVRASFASLLARRAAACSLFAPTTPKCADGDDGADDAAWDPAFLAYARTGRLHAKDVVAGAHCAGFVQGRERLEAWPSDGARANSDVAGCLRDERFRALAARLAPAGTRATLVEDLAGFASAAPAPAFAPIRLVSARDVDVEELFLQALARPRPEPFVLASLSRLHEKNLIDAFAQSAARGARVDVAVGSFSRTDAGGNQSALALVSQLSSSSMHVIPDGFLVPGSLFHDKSVVVGSMNGDARLFFSSANWSSQGLTRSDEDFFVVDDPAIVRAFVENMLRQRSLAHLPVSPIPGVAPHPIVIVRAQTPGDLDVRGRTIRLRPAGTSYLAAIELDVPVDATCAGTPIHLAPHGLASVIDVAAAGDRPALPPPDSPP